MSCLDVVVCRNTSENYSMCVVKDNMSVVAVKWWLLMVSCDPNIVFWSGGCKKVVFFFSQAIFGSFLLQEVVMGSCLWLGSLLLHITVSFSRPLILLLFLFSLTPLRKAETVTKVKMTMSA